MWSVVAYLGKKVDKPTPRVSPLLVCTVDVDVVYQCIRQAQNVGGT